MEFVTEKLQNIIEAGLLPGWELIPRRNDLWRAFLFHADCAAADEHTGIYVFPAHNSKQRVAFKARFPEFQGIFSGRNALKANLITLSTDRPNEDFARDLRRRLLDPFLAALPAAIAQCRSWQTDEAKKNQIFRGLRERVAGDVWTRDKTSFAATLHNLFPESNTVTRIGVRVKPASRENIASYPASVDLELSSVPPQLAAAILDLLSEEATS